MSSNIKPENLQKELMDYLNSYCDDITEDVKETTDTLTKEATKELKQISPRGKGSRENPYHQGWTRQKRKQTKGKYTINRYYV